MLSSHLTVSTLNALTKRTLFWNQNRGWGCVWLGYEKYIFSMEDMKEYIL